MDLTMIGTFFEYLVATVAGLTGLGIGIWVVRLILKELFENSS